MGSVREIPGVPDSAGTTAVHPPGADKAPAGRRVPIALFVIVKEIKNLVSISIPVNKLTSALEIGFKTIILVHFSKVDEDNPVAVDI
jgi:hypothetical protein